jgi:hypothetical protein
MHIFCAFNLARWQMDPPFPMIILRIHGLPAPRQNGTVLDTAASVNCNHTRNIARIGGSA